MAVRRILGWPDARQVTVSALIALLLALYAYLYLVPVFGPHAPRTDDFQDYLFAAHQLATGGDPYANFIRNHVAWASWQRRKDVVSGVLVGAAAVFKLFPLALLPYLAWRRHWKLLGAVGVTGLAGLALCLAVTSLDHNLYYFRDMLPHLAAGTGYRENQSLAGFTARLCEPTTADAGGGAGWCGRALDWPLVLLLLGIVIRATSRPVRSGLEFALAVSTLPLISSLTWSFHLVVLILPIALLIRRAFRGALSRRAGRFLLVAWLCFSVGPALHYLLIYHPLPQL